MAPNKIIIDTDPVSSIFPTKKCGVKVGGGRPTVVAVDGGQGSWRKRNSRTTVEQQEENRG
jgi:hypothetical protein